jgi:hypothetical protein
MKKEIIVLGAIGNTARQNRDNMRILGGGGTVYALKAHIDKDHPLVIKRVKKLPDK